MNGICYVAQFPEQQITYSTALQYMERAQKKGNTLSYDILSGYFNNGEYPVSRLTPLDLKVLTLGSSVTEETKLVILDEPTWGIDREGMAVLLDVLARTAERLHEESLLIISHDMELMVRLGAELLRIDGGRINKAEGRRDA